MIGDIMTIKEFFKGFVFRLYKNELAFGLLVWRKEYPSGLLSFSINSRNGLKAMHYLHYDGQTFWHGYTPFHFFKWVKEQNGYINLKEFPKPYFE